MKSFSYSRQILLFFRTFSAHDEAKHRVLFVATGRDAGRACGEVSISIDECAKWIICGRLVIYNFHRVPTQLLPLDDLSSGLQPKMPPLVSVSYGWSMKIADLLTDFLLLVQSKLIWNLWLPDIFHAFPGSQSSLFPEFQPATVRI